MGISVEAIIGLRRNKVLKNLHNFPHVHDHLLFPTLVLNLMFFFILALTVTKRHWLLEESIGTMDIENQAFKSLWITLSVGTVSFIFGSILSCIRGHF